MCSRPLPSRPIGRHQRGLSIVEIMVGVVIALLVCLAATGSAVSFLAMQRLGVAAAGAGVSSSSVMKALRDEVATAGLGFFGDSAYLCNRLNLSRGTTVYVDGALFSPLQVTRETAADRLDIVYGTRVESGATVRLAAASTGAAAILSSYLPVTPGEAVLLTPAPSATPSAVPCLMRSTTAVVPFTNTVPQQLTFDATGMHNAATFSNQPGVDTDGRVTEIGDLRWSRYRLVGTDLVLERPLDGASATVARDVIAFRVQYGVTSATAGSTSLEQWVEPDGSFASLSASNLWRVRALRIGMIVRSAQREKRDASGNCIATEQAPTLFGRAAEGLTASDWNCYRYRTSVVTVPLRNVVMGLR